MSTRGFLAVMLSLLGAAEAAAQGVHDYYDKLRARPEKVAEYSLRDQAQINMYRGKKATCITYDPANDTDPRKQDAAKVVVPENRQSLPIGDQLRITIPKTTDGSLLVTWDAWFGKEFAYDKTGVATYKQFQFSSGGAITTEVRSLFKKAQAPAIATVDVRQYSQDTSFKSDVKYPGDSLGPMVGQFAVMPETWTRYWVLFKPEGEWFEFSLWVGDEKREAVQLLDRCLIKPREGNDYWDRFWLEYNTSSEPETCPARVGYFRNLVMLKNVPEPKSLFERPVGGGIAGAVPAANPAPPVPPQEAEKAPPAPEPTERKPKREKKPERLKK